MASEFVHLRRLSSPRMDINWPSEGVSVVIPTRNRVGFLLRALRSVFAQHEPVLEIIVVDEASTDGTAATLAAIDDPRIRVIRHAVPHGVSGARNAGVAAARGRWVAFLDDDDVWMPETLAAHRRRLAQIPEARWAFGDALVLDEHLRPITDQTSPPHPFPGLLATNTVPGGGSGVIADRELVLELGGFDARLRILADWDMWIRLADSAPAAISPLYVVGYTLHRKSMTSQLHGLADELEVIAQRHSALRERWGVSLDTEVWDEWRAFVSSRGGARWAPTRTLARLGMRQGRPSLLRRAAINLVWPGSVWQFDKRHGRALLARPQVVTALDSMANALHP
jgi:Glycosyl transferase family 2